MKNVVGSIYEGEVVHKEANSYLMDLGIGFDSILEASEAEQELEVGDFVDVIVTHYNKEDYYVSMKGVSKRRNIDAIEELINSDQTIKGRVLSYKNNRFVVDLGNGVKGSVYVKNMDTKFIKEGDEYLNNEYEFIVVEKSTRGYEDFDLNRRDLVLKQFQAKKENFLSKFNVNDVVTGTVNNVISAGLTLDVDGINCFIPRSEISHGRSASMPEVGTELTAIIKEVQERSLSLKGSVKELLDHPFAKAEKLEVGSIVTGKIVKKADYGLFVELFENVDGLVHISEVSYEHTKSLGAFEENQEIEVKVIGIDKDKKKIALSIKKLQPSPYQHFIENVKVNDVISVKIKRINETGVRVMVLDNLYTTLINEDIHDFSKVKPTLRINDNMEVVVMELDNENEKIVLSNEEYVKKEYELLESSI